MIDWTLMNSSLSSCVSPWRLYKGPDKGPDRDSPGHRKGNDGTPPGSPTSQVRTPCTGSRPGPVGGPGGYPACFSSKIVPVSLADRGLEPWYISRRGPGYRGPHEVKKMDGTRARSLWVPCGMAKKRLKTARELPGKASYTGGSLSAWRGPGRGPTGAPTMPERVSVGTL